MSRGDPFSFRLTPEVHAAVHQLAHEDGVTASTWVRRLVEQQLTERGVRLTPFDAWLEITRELQTLSFGVDPGTLEGPALADYVAWNVTALVAELGETLAEFPTWKPWVVNRGQVLNRERFIGEMVDVLHFAANILCAVGCDTDELNRRYLEKVEKNRARMASGTYDGVSDKCPSCGRELVVNVRCPCEVTAA